MEFVVPKNITNLRETALKLFAEALSKVDAENALQKAIRLQNNKLEVFKKEFDLANFTEIYQIGIGKAAISMAVGINEVLGDKITAGVVSAPKSESILPSNWQIFAGGHPLPNEKSLAAARASIELLQKANHKKALVIFLISGGGSAMLELPRDENISLEDLRKANKILVGCGAKISEVNTIRRCLSQIKGGGLSSFAPLATQISLIISDTNRGDEANVASGPTIKQEDNSAADIAQIIGKYRLKELFPKVVSVAIDKFLDSNSIRQINDINHSIFTLLDNQTAVETIAKSAEKSGFITEIANDLVETPIAESCQELLKRLLGLSQKASGNPVAVISGGEFVCPVQGSGIGGRNLESALRTAILFDELKQQEKYSRTKFTALFAGTDGIDGNSPATGALADETTLARAKALNLDAHEFLANSDSYTFFAALGDEILTGATETNVRDVRILLTL
jgi:glycerate 2-kinase